MIGAGIAQLSAAVLPLASKMFPSNGGGGGGVTGLLGGITGGGGITKGTPLWRAKYAQYGGPTTARGEIPEWVKPGGRGFQGALRRAEGRGAGAIGASLPNVGAAGAGAKDWLNAGLAALGAPRIVPTSQPLPTALATISPATAPSMTGLVARGVGMAVGYGVRRLLAPRRAGGEVVGVTGEDFTSTGGYPPGPNLEDLMEQTYTPDLWARRLARGVAVLAAPIKKWYSVPLIDQTGDIEGRIRATGGPIPKSAVILYGGGAATEQAYLVGDMLKGMKLKCYCEVVDEEGGGSEPLLGAVYVPKYKRRRGGIHVSARELRTAAKVGRGLEKLLKTHANLKTLKPKRRRR